MSGISTLYASSSRPDLPCRLWLERRLEWCSYSYRSAGCQKERNQQVWCKKEGGESQGRTSARTEIPSLCSLKYLKMLDLTGGLRVEHLPCLGTQDCETCNRMETPSTYPRISESIGPTSPIRNSSSRPIFLQSPPSQIRRITLREPLNEVLARHLTGPYERSSLFALWYAEIICFGEVTNASPKSRIIAVHSGDPGLDAPRFLTA